MKLAMINGPVANAQERNASDPRLVRAAHEFEGQLMKELLKPLTGSNGLDGEDAESSADGGSNGALGEFASEALGQALSAHGGLGIANKIMRGISPTGEPTQG
jgi:Rod binding domain-containing protein